MLLLLLILCGLIPPSYSSLFAQKNEVRHFENGIALQYQRYQKDLSKFENSTVMPVPCAFNELSAEKELCEQLGWVWYQTSFESKEYFKTLIYQIHDLDSSRPATIVTNHLYFEKVADYVDLICVNRYFGWYMNHGNADSINGSLVGDVLAWRQRFGKPMILSEYGPDSIEGFSAEPSITFSVQYQIELLSKTHEAIDFLRERGDLAGEMIWSFADFMTDQGLNRVMGNHKGVLTRNRQPKMAAYLIKKRYKQLTTLALK